MWKEGTVLAVRCEVGVRDGDGYGGTVQASAFKVEDTGKCGYGSGRMGGVELAWQVGDEAWICDCWNVFSHGPLSRPHLCVSLKLHTIDGSIPSIEGYVNISCVARPGTGLMHVLLSIRCATVPDLCYWCFALPTLIKNGYVFEGRPTEVLVRPAVNQNIRSGFH